MATRTTVEWDYEPADFFRKPADFTLSLGQLHIEAGRAVYTLSTPEEPLPDAQKDVIKKEVAGVFDLQQLVNHQAYKLSRTIVRQEQPGGELYAFVSVVRSVMPVGGLGPPANEGVLEDFIRSVAPLVAGSPTLAAMLQSYGRAVRDPDDELVHLYELRDAAANYFGSDTEAREVLGIAKADWQKLGRLANEEPLRQGRHRGKKLAGLRDATPQELQEARTVARDIIDAFAASLLAAR